jgi:predicted PurR-regulated permease PerM
MPQTRWILLLVVLLFLWIVRGILAPFVVAAIFAFALTPVIDRIEARWRIRRAALVGSLYVVTIGATALVIVLLWPTFVRETRGLVLNLPEIVERTFVQVTGSDRIEILGSVVDGRTLAEQIQAALRESLGTPRDVLHAAELALGGVLTLFVFLVSFFYMLMDGRRIGEYILRFIPAERRPEVREVVGRIYVIFGRYLRGQIFLVILMSIVTWIVLTFIFHLRFALPIAIATGFLELIPYVGPVVAGTIATGTGLSQHGGGTAIGIAIAYFALRQIEDQLVIPNVVGRAVHLHPVAVIFAVLAGERIAGILGMLLAIPAAAAISIILEYWVLRSPKKADASAAPPGPPAAADEPAS